MTPFQANALIAGLTCLLAVVIQAPWVTGWLDLLVLAAQGTLFFSMFDAARQRSKDRRR